MTISECDNCGATYHWDWTEAFCKFGFNDGDGQVETWQVADVLTEAGYSVELNSWGVHNTVITSIKKNDTELILYADDDYTFGYDDPRSYFPQPIMHLLDKHLPPSGDYKLLW